MARTRFPSFPVSRLAAAVGLASAGAHATNVEVTNLNDDGPGSLRQAMITAEIDLDSDPSVISFASGVSGTINLQSALPLVTENLTINGGGVVLNAAAATDDTTLRFIPAAADQSLSLNDLSVRNAPAGAVSGTSSYDGELALNQVTIAAGSGGIALRAIDLDLTLQDSVISGNSSSASEGGAAVTLVRGTLTMADSRIEDNEADADGRGGLYLRGSEGGEISDSVISGNTSSGDGGGVSIYDTGSLTIRDTEISDNVTAYAGGGVSVRDGTVTIIDSLLSDNTAQANYGGGLHLSGSTVTIERSRISGNSGFFGGGIGADGGGSDLIVVDSAITSNSTSYWGGAGIAVAASDVAITLTRSTVSGNRTNDADGEEREGGGIYFTSSAGSLAVNDSVISDNVASGSGGGVFVGTAGFVSLSRSRVEGNSAGTGGAFYVTNLTDAASIERSVIVGNSASDALPMGRIRLIGGDLDIDESTIADHAAGSAAGPGLRVELGTSSSSVDIRNSTISGNTAEESVLLVDGSLYAASSGDAVNIINSTFSGNRSTAAQSVLLFRELDVNIEHATFVDNTATLPAAIGGGSAQVSVHASTTNGEGGFTSFSLLRSVMTSENDDEVLLGGEAFVDGALTGVSGPVNATLEQLVLEQGFATGNGAGTVNFGSGLPVTADPLLAPLADRGGFTRVHEPLQGSPVIDAGNEGSRPLDRDQRGLSGTQNLNRDLGAVEVTSNTPPRLVTDLPAQLGGVVGDTVAINDVLAAFVDDDGDTISIEDVQGLPAGLTFDGTNAITGTLEAVGDSNLTLIVTDDAAAPLQTVVQATISVTAEPPRRGGGGGGSVPLGALALFGFLALLRRR